MISEKEESITVGMLFREETLRAAGMFCQDFDRKA